MIALLAQDGFRTVGDVGQADVAVINTCAFLQSAVRESRNAIEQLAALNRTNINVQLLAVEAALTHKRETVYHAAMLDPHTSAELTLDQIRSLCDDLIAAHGMEAMFTPGS